MLSLPEKQTHIPQTERTVKTSTRLQGLRHTPSLNRCSNGNTMSVGATNQTAPMPIREPKKKTQSMTDFTTAPFLFDEDCGGKVMRTVCISDFSHSTFQINRKYDVVVRRRHAGAMGNESQHTSVCHCNHGPSPCVDEGRRRRRRTVMRLQELHEDVNCTGIFPCVRRVRQMSDDGHGEQSGGH